MERLLQLVQICSQLTGTAVVVPGSVYLAEGWRGNVAWEKAQARAKEAGVSLKIEDYQPAELPEKDRLLDDPIFLSEINAPRGNRLESWTQLPGVDWGSTIRGIRPGEGKGRSYREFFREEMTEEVARVKLAKMAATFEERLDRLTKSILSKPRQAVYARLETKNPDTSGDYLRGAQQLFGAYQSSACMALHSGRAERALRSIEVIEHLAAGFRDSNFIGVLIEEAGQRVADGLIWEGIRLHAWNEVQLGQLEGLLSQRESVENLKKALGYEASWMVGHLDEAEESEKELLKFPNLSYWRDHFLNWWYFEGTRGWRAHRMALSVNAYLDMIAWLNKAVDKRNPWEEVSLGGEWSPLWGMKSALSVVDRAAMKLSKEKPTKQKVVLAVIACEKMFLKTGNYPKTLADLKLNFPLTDLTDREGRDLSYRLDPLGRPVIWSRAEEDSEGYRSRRKLRWQFYEKEKEGPARGRGRPRGGN